MRICLHVILRSFHAIRMHRPYIPMDIQHTICKTIGHPFIRLRPHVRNRTRQNHTIGIGLFHGRHGSPYQICIFPGILRGVADFPMTSPKCHRIRFVPYFPYNISPFIVFYQLSCKIGISRTSRFVFHMPVQFITKSHTANNFQTSLLTIVYKTIILTKIINTFFSFDRFPNKTSSYPLHT